MKDETITRTIVCKLATSNRKNERVRQAVEEWQTIAARMAELMPSFGPAHWRSQDSTLFHVVQNEFPNRTLPAHAAYEAAYKVGEAFKSWNGNGRRGENPQGLFGDGDYARFPHDSVAVEKNERGYGLKVTLEPYNPEWFHIRCGDYQREHLKRITDGSASSGSAELHFHGDGALFAHLTVKRDIEVFEAIDVESWVGVDLGENVLFAAAVVGTSGVKSVEMESGKEFRHYRDRLNQRRYELSERGDLHGVRKTRGLRERYTDHVTHEVAKRIVNFAAKGDAGGIRVENLTGYRENAEDAIHDWPQHDIREKIATKATESGRAFEQIEPRYTSITCRKCGQRDGAARVGPDFNCRRCGYQIHADVNAAINIAMGGVN